MIQKFIGINEYLSNFYPSPFRFNHPDVGWCRCSTVEHGYQSLKTSDRIGIQQILMCDTPGQSKRMGRKVEIRPGWDELKVGYMLGLLTLKFTHHPDLGYRLTQTGDELLIEGNRWHDNFWGVCECLKCRKEDKINGQNNLGQLLMQVRRELQR